MDNEQSAYFSHGTGQLEISPEWAVLAIKAVCEHLGIDGIPKLGRILREIEELKKPAEEPKEDFGISLDVYHSTRDGTVTVHINTGEDLPENQRGPQLRVYINDDTINPVYDNPLETGDPHYCDEECVDA